MQVRYINVTGGTPKVVPLDNNVEYFQVSVRWGGTTLEFCLEQPDDSVAPSSYRQPVGPAPTWLAAPAAVNGVVSFAFPVAAIRFSNATDTVATVLQQGIR